MQTMQQQITLRQLENGQAVNGDMIQKLIDDSTDSLNRIKLKKKYDNYLADENSLDIFKREFEDKTKINAKINNDYRGYIVDLFLGYLLGNNINYSLDKEAYSNDNDETTGGYNKLSKVLRNFVIINDMETADIELSTKSFSTGISYRLCYINSGGEVAIVNINPWQAIILEDDRHSPKYGLYFYKEYGSEGEEYTVAEFYDNSYYYIFDNSSGEYKLKEKKEHLFSYMPLVKFRNNAAELGDFDKVTSIIEAYNRMISDSQNEIEEFRLAYMKFIGCEADKDTIIKARESGAFNVPEGADVGYITKDINDTFLENHKKTLRENIFKFSKTVDITDQTFSGSAESGEARKWKLLAMENQGSVKEKYFKKSLRQQFKIICSAWNKKNIPINYLDIDFNFSRNIPVDLSYLGNTAQNLKGVVSDDTLFDKVLGSIVDDKRREKELIKSEAPNVDLESEIAKIDKMEEDKKA